MNRFEQLQKIHQKKDEGIINYIPVDFAPKLKQYVPGILKGTPYVITASTGVK
jgi:hypothetical protein